MRIPQATFILFLIATYMSGQSVVDNEQTIFQQARTYAFEDKNYEKAITLVQQETVKHPQDMELSLFLARLLFWNKQNLSAEKQTLTTLSATPDDYEVHKLLIDIYESQSMYEKSTAAIKNALVVFPEDKNLMYRLAYNLSKVEKFKYAKALTAKLLEDDPENAKLINLYKSIRTNSTKNFIFAEYRHHFLHTKEQLLNFKNLKYSRDINRTTLIAGISSGRSIEHSGMQYSLEMYNDLGKKYYSYIHLAYSNSVLFPGYRLNSAIFKSFDHNIEGSVYISLIQSEGIPTRLVATSLTKNIKNSSFGGSVNVINKSFQNEITYRVRYRQYFKNHHNFVGIAYGSFSKDETIQGAELELSAKYISYEGQASIGTRALIGLNYNRNISEGINSRDQLSIYTKHNF